MAFSQMVLDVRKQGKATQFSLHHYFDLPAVTAWFAVVPGKPFPEFIVDVLDLGHDFVAQNVHHGLVYHVRDRICQLDMPGRRAADRLMIINHLVIGLGILDLFHYGPVPDESHLLERAERNTVHC